MHWPFKKSNRLDLSPPLPPHPQKPQGRFTFTVTCCASAASLPVQNSRNSKNMGQNKEGWWQIRWIEKRHFQSRPFSSPKLATSSAQGSKCLSPEVTAVLHYQLRGEARGVVRNFLAESPPSCLWPFLLFFFFQQAVVADGLKLYSVSQTKPRKRLARGGGERKGGTRRVKRSA